MATVRKCRAGGLIWVGGARTQLAVCRESRRDWGGMWWQQTRGGRGGRRGGLYPPVYAWEVNNRESGRWCGALEEMGWLCAPSVMLGCDATVTSGRPSGIDRLGL